MKYYSAWQYFVKERPIALSKKPLKSDLNRIDPKDDEDIDYSDIPVLDDKFIKEVRLVTPPGKKRLISRLDADVQEWLKSLRSEYQTRINAILRFYYGTHNDAPHGNRS